MNVENVWNCCIFREQTNAVVAERSAIEIKLLQDKVGRCFFLINLSMTLIKSTFKFSAYTVQLNSALMDTSLVDMPLISRHYLRGGPS